MMKRGTGLGRSGGGMDSIVGVE